MCLINYLQEFWSQSVWTAVEIKQYRSRILQLKISAFFTLRESCEVDILIGVCETWHQTQRLEQFLVREASRVNTIILDTHTINNKNCDLKGGKWEKPSLFSNIWPRRHDVVVDCALFSADMRRHPKNTSQSNSNWQQSVLVYGGLYRGYVLTRKEINLYIPLWQKPTVNMSCII